MTKGNGFWAQACFDLPRPRRLTVPSKVCHYIVLQLVVGGAASTLAFWHVHLGAYAAGSPRARFIIQHRIEFQRWLM